MKAVWLAAGLLAAAFAVVTLHDALLVFFAAAIFAVPLRGASVALARLMRAPVGVGLVCAIVVLAALVAANLWLWETLIAVQVHQLLVALPGAAHVLARAARTEPWASRIAAVVPDPSVLLTGAGGVVGALRNVAGGTLATLVDVAILIFATVCFAAEPRTYIAALQEAAGTIALWLRARLISMVTVGTLVAIGLRIAGIPDATALGLLAAIFAFVPNIGAIAAALPSLLLAAPLGWQRVVAVVALYWLAHALDDFFVIPIAERRVVRLPPALTIAAQLVLGIAGGALGVMTAAPFVAVAIVLVRRLVVDDIVERAPQRARDRAG
jgi:predicted PurR-regulated permease PerM